MSLKPRKPNQEKKRFSAYDLEWYPGIMKFRMCGVYDQERGYRYYASMISFLLEELTPENYGRVFYAHNGGKSDMHFVLDTLIQSGLASDKFIIEAAFNGSSAFLVQIRERENSKNCWIFADTLFLLRSSLKNIGKWLGYEKMELDDFATEDFNLLRLYNERDCMVLYRAVEELEAELHEMGGEFKTTLASSAMALFQTKYLKQILPTDKATNDITRKAYYASRVEVLTRTCDKGLYADVNSSFPWSMRQTLPGKFLGSTKSLSRKPRGAVCYIAEATVKVKECYLPPLPYRDTQDRILFPTGTWTSSFVDVDLQLLEEEGHEILEIHSVDWFEGFTALKDYVDDLYERKSTSTGFKREVYKLLLNSLYGKFAEGELKKKLLIHPDDVSCPHKIKHVDEPCMDMIRPGFWMRSDYKMLPHVHVPISAAVTAHSRALLYRYMKKPLDRGGKVYYTDTDSIVYSTPCDHTPKHGDGLVPNRYMKNALTPSWQVCMWDALPTGEEVGELKMEYALEDGIFAAPKLYMMEAGGKIVVRSKGFSRMDGTDFLKLCAGETIILGRMSGLKENIRSGDTTPREIKVPKVARFRQTKRANLGTSGETRPWTVEEILKSEE